MRNHRKIKAVRNTLGITGYAIWNMLLEYLTDMDGNEFPHNDGELELISGDFGISVTEITVAINYYLKLGLLQVKNGFICSESLHDYLEPVYEKRGRARQISRQQARENGKFKQSNAVDDGISVTEKPQSKVEYSKGNNYSNNNNKSAGENFEVFDEKPPPDPIPEITQPPKEENPSVARPSPYDRNVDIQNYVNGLLPVDECYDLFFNHPYFDQPRELNAGAFTHKDLKKDQILDLMGRWGRAFNRYLILMGEVERKPAGSEGWQKHFGNWSRMQDKFNVNPDDLQTPDDFYKRTKPLNNFKKYGKQPQEPRLDGLEHTQGGIPTDNAKAIFDLVTRNKPE